jgi:acetyl esterase/lipase
MALLAARNSRAKTVSPDYRMPPDFPYPTPLDDCLSVYQAVLEEYKPEQIVVGGGSAGGNLAAAMILKARDAGMALPAGLILLSPEVDLTESGDSFTTNRYIDVVLRESLAVQNALYANGHDLSHPYISPLFGDFLPGFTKTFLQTGTRDLFLSNTVRMHRTLLNACVEAELHVFEAMPHGGFLGTTPEDLELHDAMRRFIESCWNSSMIS